ncbi:hypothetical protein EDB89DRAFT_2036720 [Lactarius sanguifluus]|nr:hypothetical protein EDB89DRAFT_2036720 [Lactarius sanguifluus]
MPLQKVGPVGPVVLLLLLLRRALSRAPWRGRQTIRWCLGRLNGIGIYPFRFRLIPGERLGSSHVNFDKFTVASVPLDVSVRHSSNPCVMTDTNFLRILYPNLFIANLVHM